MTQSLWCKNHVEVDICACGANRICMTCGSGSGSIPCKCSPAIDAWQEWEEASDEALAKFEEDL